MTAVDSSHGWGVQPRHVQELGEWQVRLHALLLQAADKQGQAYAVVHFGLQRLRDLDQAAQAQADPAPDRSKVTSDGQRT